MTWCKIIRAIFSGFVLDDSTEDVESDPEGSFREISVVNCPTTKTESLERTLDRAESVLKEQLADLSDIQDRAIKLVWIEAILLGALASVVQITPNPLPANIWLTVSGAFLVASITVGIFTSSSSSPDYGPGPDYVRPNIESGNANDKVYLELLEGYSEAISYNRSVVNESAKYLFVTQSLLVSGVVLGSTAVFVF